MGDRRGNAVHRVINNQRRPPQQRAQPQQRLFIFAPSPATQLVGTPFSLALLGISYITGPNNAIWDTSDGQNEVYLGTNNITVIAYDAPGWVGASTQKTITGIRAKVPLLWKPKPSWGLHEVVTLDELQADYDGSALTHNYMPDIRLAAPAGGVFAAAGDAVPVTIQIVQDNCFVAVTATAKVKVVKQAAVISWRPPLPMLAGWRLTTGQLNARTQPTIPARLPAIVYDPPLNKVFPNVQTVQLKASCAGNAWFGAAADKIVTLKIVADVKTMGVEAMESGAAWKGPQNQAASNLLDKWHSDDSPTGLKMTSRKVMSDIKGMTGEEMVDYMDKLINPTGNAPVGSKKLQGGKIPNVIWELPNGLQVRYKPDGDGKQPPGMPPVPMFCVEGKTCVGTSENKDQVAFKVTKSGEPAAYGPAETEVPPGITTNPNDPVNKAYMLATLSTTHFPVTPKVAQTITWADPPPITVGDKLGKASLDAKADDPKALVYTDASGTVITEETILPEGLAQVLKVSATATTRYLASAAPVTVKIDVKPKVEVKPEIDVAPKVEKPK